jgi:hypothetical protein
MPHPALLLGFVHPRGILGLLRVIELPSMQFSPASRHFFISGTNILLRTL